MATTDPALNHEDPILASQETDHFLNENETDMDILNDADVPTVITKDGFRNHFDSYGIKRSWNTRQICLGLMFVVMFVAIILLIGLLIFYHSRYHDIVTNKVCNNTDCVIAAGNILSKINASAIPCQDFYNFACGRYVLNTAMPPGYTRWGIFDKLSVGNSFRIKKSLESLIETQAKGGHVLATFQKVTQLYQSCINLTTINNRGSRPLLQLLDKLNHWSFFLHQTPWNESQWDFDSTLVDVHYVGVTPFLSVSAEVDGGNSSRYLLQAHQSGLGLSSVHYYITNSSILHNYKDYMVEVSKLLGIKEEFANPQMEKIIQLEKSLAKHFVKKEDLTPDKTYHLRTMKDLIKMCPEIPWMKLVANLTGTNINLNTPINVRTPHYLSHLSNIIKQTNKQVVATYLMWTLIHPLVHTLSQPFRDANLKLEKAIYGRDLSANKPRWQTCIRNVIGSFGFATGRLFVNEHFQGSSKKQALEMIEGIKKAFVNNLPSVQWMDPKTASKAKEKANNVISLIGYPDWILDDTKLNDYYKMITINFKQFFENSIAVARFANYKQMLHLRTPVDRKTWFMNPSTVNAYYEQSFNDIAFPAGILQQPFFNKNFPKYLNYGGIGVAMGHELTHGFDSSGRKFDKNGNLKPWWGKKANEAYENRAKCMMDQYSAYKIANTNVNGNLTITENIADNGGMKFSYTAYTNWIKANGPEPLLPGIKYTPDQLLFISFAQLWCSIETPQTIRHLILTNRHSPSKIRVIGTLSNSKAFSDAFNCPLGSPMNPKHKCKIW